MFKNVGKLACFQKKLSERYDNHLLILRVEVSEYLKATINVLATSYHGTTFKTKKSDWFGEFTRTQNQRLPYRDGEPSTGA